MDPADPSLPDETLTVQEFIHEFEAAEEEAELVLGGDDGSMCTYPKGYVKRQALFSCITCTPGGEAGFCVACAIKCHEGHQIEEIYTKRNFRCDCGNSKFVGLTCKLFREKDKINDKNLYNHNFIGKYCTCSRPYPDPNGYSGDTEDMIQCCICEDWFHEDHLGLDPAQKVPCNGQSEYDFDELICQVCSKKCGPFVTSIPSKFLVLPIDSNEQEGTPKQNLVDAHEKHTAEGTDEITSGGSGKRKFECTEEGKLENACEAEMEEQKEQFTPESLEERIVSDLNSTLRKESTNSEELCPSTLNGNVPDRERKSTQCKMKVMSNPQRALFLRDGWRTELCHCERCLRVLREEKLEFLLSEDDTIAVYEEAGMKKRVQSEPNDQGLEKLMGDVGMSRIQQVEMIHGFNEMSSKLKEFLVPFTLTGEVVTAEAISSFFHDLNQKRRRGA